MLFDGTYTTNCSLRQKIRDFYRIDESIVIDHLLPLAEIGVSAKSRAWERARTIVVNIRSAQHGQGGIDALLSEFSLSSEEGVVLMCLAEALLRVPDPDTQDKLIRDKLASADWSSHLGNSDSLFVNASSWGLLITGKMVNYSDSEQQLQFGVLKRTLGRLGEPVIRKSVQYAMMIMGRQFVMGQNINEAIPRAVEKENKGYTYSYDMLGEGARTMDDADQYFESYLSAIQAIGQAAKGRGPIKSPGISVKLSAIHPRYQFSQRNRVMTELVPRLMKLALAAKKYNISLTVDAEEANRLDISLDVIEAVFSNDELADWEGFGIAVQAYQKRALFIIEWLRQLTESVGRKMMVRLVKGAYWDSEIKSTQQDGLSGFPVFTRKAATDVCYTACAIKLMQYRDTIYPQFATHNAYTAATILEMADGENDNFEFQRLHGMGESLFDQIVAQDNIQCRIYAPVGKHQDLLAYLVRRLLENGANSSFVNAIVDDTKPVESLLLDPVEKMQNLRIKHNPQITLPKNLYLDERDNSLGRDLTDINVITPLKTSLNRWFSEHQISLSEVPETAKVVINPAKSQQIIGYVFEKNAQQMQQLVANAEVAFKSWSTTTVKHRADMLRNIADILEHNEDELIALCTQEAGKTIQDGIDEVREAVDFCRYYAAGAEQLFKDHRFLARGVVLCISPWNFPLAIFLGQVAAAIVTGNTVIAKPAGQTPLIALRAIALMQEAGLPENVVQAVIARGSEVGRIIIPDSRIKAVMFTGSTATGTTIAQILASRGGELVPLVAETGGQNCMIVDSTALPEQVVDDVISSGFQSAGQRCSALRVLFLQEEIAEKVIDMLKGAMQELTLGDPADLATDIGPVIDQSALDALNNHVDYLSEFTPEKAFLHYQCQLPDSCKSGSYFFAPRLYELETLSLLKAEVFGPCVHLIRFKGSEIDGVVDQINHSGYGLTMGIHTRIERRAQSLAKRSNAGNIYINRNMIGAVVGVQPFGGRGLSGTGPKAGGPHYLARLVRENDSANRLQSRSESSVDRGISLTDDESQQLARLMENSQAAVQGWRSTSLTQRISSLRQLLAKIASIDSVEQLAENLEQTLTDARAQLIRIENRISEPLELPGPTGESNTLHLEPRGCIVCYADQETRFNFWVLSMVTALATGNTVVTVVSDLFYKEALAFCEKFTATGVSSYVLQVATLNQLPGLLNHPHLAGVVIGKECENKSFISRVLAARKGAILPIICTQYYETMINRLLTEKTISIDTTASGGNASLMTLAND